MDVFFIRFVELINKVGTGTKSLREVLSVNQKHELKIEQIISIEPTIEGLVVDLIEL